MLLDSVVIGDTIESALYAYLSDSYFIPTCDLTPLFYERMDLAFLGSRRKDYTWSRIQTIMALTGKLMNYEDISSIRVEEERLKINSGDGFAAFPYNRCVIFNTNKVAIENEILEQRKEKYTVYDDFEISQLGGKHSYLEPKSEEPGFASRIVYYTSDRVDGANYVTDCVVESCMSKEELNNIEYSDSIVRFAVLRHLESIGIYGSFMNFYKNGKPKYRKPKVVHKKRVLKKVERNSYKDTEKVKIKNLNLEEILDEFSTSGP